MQLVVSVTNECNLNCTHCLVDQELKSELEMNDVRKIASTFDASAVGIIGGEPYMRRDLNKICDELAGKSITIYTNGTMLAKHPERIIEGVHHAVSIDGLQPYHDSIRGAGRFNEAMEALKHLAVQYDKGRIPSVWIRMTISMDNKNDIIPMSKIADELGVSVMYFPLLGKRIPFPSNFQHSMFKWASQKDNITVYSPPFWQFCGYEQSTCQAGKYRLHIDEHGEVNPCQWLKTALFGNVADNEYDSFVSQGINYYKNHVTVKPECRRCFRMATCKGGCRLSPDSLTCPNKHGMVAENVLDIDSVRVASQKFDRTFRNLKIVGC